MAELTEEQVETVAEAVPEIVESLLALKAQFTLIGMSFGALISFFATRRYLEQKYNAIAEEEISQMRDHFRARMRAREEKPDLGNIQEKVEDLGYSQPNTPDIEEMRDEVLSPEEVEEVEAVVEEEKERVKKAKLLEEQKKLIEPEPDRSKPADEGWDYEKEREQRRPDRPYIIHVDEKHEAEYTESSLVYYEGDDILADMQDNVIENPDEVVGTDNLGKFGHGSPDRDIVYIRNDHLAVEMEIVKNEGFYAEIVHGLYVKHSAKSRPKRPRRKHLYDDE